MLWTIDRIHGKFIECIRVQKSGGCLLKHTQLLIQHTTHNKWKPHVLHFIKTLWFTRETILTIVAVLQVPNLV